MKKIVINTGHKQSSYQGEKCKVVGVIRLIRDRQPAARGQPGLLNGGGRLDLTNVKASQAKPMRTFFNSRIASCLQYCCV